MERILVGLDASPNAQRVLARAVDLARRTGAKLILFRAVGLPRELPHEAYALPPDEMAERLESDAKAQLERLTSGVDPALVQGTLVHIGTAWQAICSAAKEQSVDLIIIGSHGYGGLDHIVGTTAAKVVDHADRSVLVVREAKS
jgi:nucleotide-binding universal stress UspA family protein